jgi:hypothetical protein
MRHRLGTTGEVTVMTLFMNDVLLAAYDRVRLAIAYFSESYSSKSELMELRFLFQEREDWIVKL